VLNLTGSLDTVLECTSANFNGCLALMDPKTSWVAKWQRIEGYVPGVYAVQVIGQLPDGYVQDLTEQGLRYVPRDGPREVEVETGA
jgi:transcription elongation factor SPT4